VAHYKSYQGKNGEPDPTDDPRLGWTMQWVKGGDRELANDK